MFRPLMAGITRLTRWIASMSTETMSQAIFDSCQEAKIYATNEKSQISKPVYDILNCGSRNRFTVLTDSGPLIVHNCILGLGYGMGAEKFKGTLKIGVGGISVDLPLSEAQRVVKLYRDSYPYIAKLWKQGQEALEAMIAGHEYELGEAIKLKCKDSKIWLPNGMFINYPNLRKSGNEFLYDSRYGPNKIYGGKVIENVVQALARIVVFDQMAKIDQEFRKLDTPAKRHKVCLTVHDEIVAVVPKDYVEEAIHFMGKIMLQTPSWCSDLPVFFEADSGESYGDCK